jgi:HEAT repeat protein
VLQVFKVSAEKRVILYKKVADVKGRFDHDDIKHRITDGLHPREPKTILDWAEPGKIAVCFSNGKVCQICLGRYWYECVMEGLPWWGMTRGRPELCLAYYGTAARLRQHLGIMLAGRETVITAILHGVDRWQGYESVAFRQSLRGREVPIGRIKASLSMPDAVGELMTDPRFLVGKGGGGPEDVGPLLEALQDKAPGTRAEAAEGLGLLGGQARIGVPALTKALEEDPDRLVRIRAAGARLRIGPPSERALKVLLEAARDTEAVNRKAAVETLGDIGREAKAAVPVLIATLADQDARVRWAAIEALGQFGREARVAVPPLLEALKDSLTRSIAIDVLGKFGDTARTAVPALILLCQDPDRKVRAAAAAAIIRIEVDGPETAAVRTAVPVFLDGLKSRDEVSRWQAVWCFKWLGSKGRSGIPELVRLAQSQDASTCVGALECLAAIGPAAKAAVSIPRGKLKDPNGEVRIMAAQALWRIEHDTQTAVAVSKEALKDSDRQVRVLAAQLLGEMRAQAKGADLALLEALADPDRSVRWAAASALAGLRSETRSRIPQLIAALKNDDPRVRGKIAGLLGQLGRDAEPAVPALAECLHDSDAHVRIIAARSLVSMGRKTQAVVDAVVNTVKNADKRLRLQAIRLLGNIGTEARPALDTLSALMKDEDPDVRGAAREAMKKVEAGPTSTAAGALESKPEEVSPSERHGPEWAKKLAVGSVLATLVVLGGFLIRKKFRRPANC